MLIHSGDWHAAEISDLFTFEFQEKEAYVLHATDIYHP
jgi:hypothetical protein